MEILFQNKWGIVSMGNLGVISQDYKTILVKVNWVERKKKAKLDTKRI